MTRTLRTGVALAVLLLLLLSPGCDDRPKQAIDALARGDVEEARRLYESGANVDAVLSDGSGGGASALMAVASTDEVDVAKMLLEFGADPNVQSGNGVTALMVAASHGNVAVARVLLDAGADGGLRDTSGASALDRATRSGNADLIRLLSELPG